MTTKKSNSGKGTGPSPRSRKTKTATTKKSEQGSSAKPAKRKAAIKKTPPIGDPRIPTIEELQADIAKRAYELYQRRGTGHGQDLSDWLQAEREILIEKSLVKP